MRMVAAAWLGQRAAGRLSISGMCCARALASCKRSELRLHLLDLTICSVISKFHSSVIADALSRSFERDGRTRGGILHANNV